MNVKPTLSFLALMSAASSVPEDPCGQGVANGNVYRVTLLEEQPLDPSRTSCGALDGLAPSSSFKVEVMSEFAASSPICTTSMGKLIEPPESLGDHVYAGRSNGFSGGRSERPGILVKEKVKTGPQRGCSARWQTAIFFGADTASTAAPIQAIRRELIPDAGQAECKYCYDDWRVKIEAISQR